MLPTIFTERASKTSVSQDASDTFHRSFQNDRFVRSFLQISQNKLPKRAFRAMRQTIFIRKSFQNDRFVRGFLQISQNNASKTSVSRDASDNFHQKCAFRYSFCAIDTPNPMRGFIRQNQNVRLATTACHPKVQNVRFATAACAKMYESIDREPTRFAHTKM